MKLSSTSVTDKKAILDIINEELYPKTAKEIRIKLLRTGRKIPEYLITRTLRSLLSEDKVRYKGGRWMNNETFSQSNTIQTGYPSRIVELPTLSDAAEEVLPNANKPDPEFEDGTWSKFRNLISYYSECLRNEEGADASSFIDDIGKKYMYATGVGGWTPVTGKSWSYGIPLGDYNQDFVESILNQNNIDNIVVVGYPVEAVCLKSNNGPDTRIIRPVFQYIMNTKFTDNSLNISTSNSQPELSLEWMKYALNDYSKQFHFLSHCGLINQSRAIDEPIGFTSDDVRPSLDELTKRLSSFMPKKIREPLNPRSVNGHSIPSDFKNGIYNKAVIMIGKRTRYTQTLLKELNIIKSQSDEVLNKTALKHIFTKSVLDNESAEPKPPHEETVSDALLMNAEQRESVDSILNEDITVVTGPPGTGKSQVVMGAVANARIQDKSVLFASRNHKAIDAVVDRLKDQNGGSLIVRTNSKNDPNMKFTFKDAINELQMESHDADALRKYKQKKSQLNKRLVKRGEYAISLNKIWELRDEIGDLEDKISWLKEEIPGKTISVLEKSYQNFITKELENFDQIIKLVKKYTVNKSDSNWVNYFFDWVSVLRSWVSLNKSLEKILKDNIEPFPPLRYKDLSDIDIKLLGDIKSFIEYSNAIVPLETKLKDFPETSDLIEKIKDLNKYIEEHTSMLLTLHSTSHSGLIPDGEDRESLASLKNALTQQNRGFENHQQRDEVEKRLLKYIPILLKNYPCWAVTNLSVGSRIPIAPAIYDISIIDEASQCDIASAIPIMYRSKSATVVGDPNQLSHVSKLNISKDSLLRNSAGLAELDDMRYSYRETSLFDLFASNNIVSSHLLKETYRSTVDITEYSNQTFYRGSLRVATNESKLNIPRGASAGIHWTETSGPVVSAGGSGCVSESEIDTIHDLVKTILVDNNYNGTLGVVTPFRQQQKRLLDRIYDTDIPHNRLLESEIIIDTAHGFQGDEKDVMIFSLCSGPDMPRGSMHFIKEKSHLFNVAVSRARAVLHIVGNKEWALGCGINHIVNLAKPPKKDIVDPKKSNWAPHESPWEKELYEALRKKGIKTIPQYPASGRRLDLALINKKAGLKIDIEVDSDQWHRNPDGSRKKGDHWRDIYLMGMGWTIMRFWVYNLKENMDKCVAKIEKVWREHE